MPWRMNSRLIVLMAASWPSQMGTAVRMRMTRSVFTCPDHADVAGVGAADVECQVALAVGNLSVAGAVSQMQVRLDDLAHAGRADGMAVADETAAGIDERRAAFLQKLRALTGLGEAEQFVRDDFRNRKAVMHL